MRLEMELRHADTMLCLQSQEIEILKRRVAELEELIDSKTPMDINHDWRNGHERNNLDF
jgi:hypothetical protein